MPDNTHLWQTVLRLAFTDGTPWRALKLALVVGTALVLINQWEALRGEVAFSYVKALLTYLVPYLVSTYTSVVKDLHGFQKGSR